MAQKILVIGAGIIGANIAYALQRSGAEVTVVDSGGASATQSSFGWINASFFLDHDHFQLRSASIAAYRDLSQELSLLVNWSGCLCFENAGDAFDQQANALRDIGYAFEEIDAQAFSKLVPALAPPPERCLVFAQEAAAESGALAAALLSAAIAQGARALRGVRVEGFVLRGDRIVGVRTSGGELYADQVISAVGVGTQALMASLDVTVPMLTRPAVMLRTRPVPPITQHVLVTEIGEVRQLPDGALMMPAAVSHQRDASEVLSGSVQEVTDQALGRLQGLFPDVPLSLAEISLAHRPVPADERPVVGPVMAGLYVTCMHSGITLGALVGRDVATEVLRGPSNETAKRFAPYRPGRFAA